MRIFLVVFVTLMVLLGAGAVGGYYFYTQAQQQRILLTAEQSIEVPAGASPISMINQLQQKGIIKSAFWLKLYWRFEHANQQIHAGEYLLKPKMPIKYVFSLWLKGEVTRYKITLVEGWSFKQVRAALARHSHLEKTLSGLSDDQIMEALKIPGKHPEGLFFPDTYIFMKGDTDLDILKQAHKRLIKTLDDEWENKADNLPYTSPYEALIMASVVEKETGVDYERPQIAGVFVRRLQKNMLLQTDPTVIYGMGERYRGKITRADLKEATPYNTYVITGLPPTPIAMVGREAIHAALHPAAGSALYFVAKGDGSHEFSDTLNQHNQAVRKYQLKRKAGYRSSPPPRQAP